MAKTGDQRDELREKIAKEQVVVLVGSGVSYAATGRDPLATWPGLLEGGTKCLHAVDRRAAAAVRRELEAKDFLASAERLREGLEKHGKLDEWMRDTIGGLQSKPRVDGSDGPDILSAIQGLGVPIATTNYDHLLERATGRDPLTWKYPSRISNWMDGSLKAIYHVHGSYQDPASVVLSIRNYVKVEDKEPSEHMLKSVFTSKSVLLIGCGDAGLSDPHFTAIRAWMRTNFQDDPPKRHYRLVTGGTKEWRSARRTHEADRRFLDLINAGPHEDLASFVQSLAPPQRTLSIAGATPAEDPALDEHRRYALPIVTKVSMIGLSHDDLQFDLKDLFVPLVLNEDHRGGAMGFERISKRPPKRGELDIDHLFATLKPGENLLIRGEPGTGKTTCAKKIVAAILGNDPLGMDFGKVRPRSAAFVRLRHLRDEEIATVSHGRVESWLGAAMRDSRPDTPDSSRGKKSSSKSAARSTPVPTQSALEDRVSQALACTTPAIWVFDGLDEVADATLRRAVCEQLALAAARFAKSGAPIRLVLTSRFGPFFGAFDSRDHDRNLSSELGSSFRHVTLAKLEPPKQAQLVHQWFQRLIASNPKVFNASKMTKLAQELQKELQGSRRKSDQRFQTFAGTPLLTTLLCILKWQTRSIPDDPGIIVSECVEVLLERRNRIELGGKPPAAPMLVNRLLGPIAFELKARRGEQEFASVRFRLSHTQLARGGAANLEPPERILHWLHHDASIIDKTKESTYRFAHGLIQDHFVARHIALGDAKNLDVLVENLGDRSTWEEVVRLFLQSDESQRPEKLFEQALRSPLDSDQTAVLADLAGFCPVPATAALLTLLSPHEFLGLSHRPQSGILELCRTLKAPGVFAALSALEARTECPPRIKSAISRLGLSAPPPAPGASDHLFMVWSQDRRELAEEISTLLKPGFQVLGSPSACTPSRFHELADLGAQARAAILIVGNKPPPSEFLEDASCALQIIAVEKRPLLVLGTTKWSGHFKLDPSLAVTHLGTPKSASSAADLVRSALALRPNTTTSSGRRSRPRKVAIDAFTEPTTGLHFLPVPGGEFMMGEAFPQEVPEGWDPDSWKTFREWTAPPHPVRISPFWLAETSVTNAHYEQFRKSRGGKTKGGSTQRDFILPNQPVVEVSWEDAMEFCSWLNEKSEGGKWRFVLPTEAQREFAVRSSDNRPFPWGRDRPPTEKLAVFGGKLSAPAPVGSCPDGKGPFGHLDLAGNVWEWCLDPWVENAYKRRSSDRARPTVDPGSDFEPAAEVRCARGGAWLDSAEYLRSAVRSRNHRTGRFDDLGFRVAAVPASR